MKPKSFLRRNWFWVAGISFLGIHFGTYFIQKVAKSSARESVAIKDAKSSE
ncbi:uncharacterized protein LOC142296078 [Anomaloglossus baeobatrachus]|uniref:uncharacterized protein LOC142296078 n=1 Tax=Anomaloglossus baeobatrachus TaxID=238106 RepID=UPI003F501E69